MRAIPIGIPFRSAFYAWGTFLLAMCILRPGVAQVASQGSEAGGAASNVVCITLDGLRGEEVFTGVDRRLALPELGVKDPEAFLERFDAESAEERRRKLMPFLWHHIAADGWIAGDWSRDSTVLVTNGRYFSYPGYSELLCGFPDDRIDSNAKRYNPNVTVLEWLNSRPGFAGRVAAFGSWDVFPFIINDRRSGIPVNAGWAPLTVSDTPRVLEVLNTAAEALPREWESVRYDAFTAAGAIEYLRAEHPRVLYISLGETDDWAHAGRYDRYIEAARYDDALIRRVWEAVQELEAYRDRTAFLISVDHGRGDGREGWKSHSRSLPGSERIWIAAFGPGIARRGIDAGGHFTQSQLAATAAALVGEDYRGAQPRAAAPLPIVTAQAGPTPP